MSTVYIVDAVQSDQMASLIFQYLVVYNVYNEYLHNWIKKLPKWVKKNF